MNVIAQAFNTAFNAALKEASDRLANPARVSDPDKLRGAVAGKTVLVVARSAERLDELAASINAGGGHAFAYPTDLTDETAVTVL
ncbi:MAG: epimerase, partial [Mycobacterium sp.]